MGQEIDATRFEAQDFAAFAVRLEEETARLRDWFRDGRFSARDRVGGFELEAWLVDGANRPAPVNEAYLARLDDPLVVPELARFNVELNAPPEPLTGPAFTRLHDSLAATWLRCGAVAAELDVGLAMIGILPTLQETDLVPANMSRLRRYHALNQQVLRQRQGRPLHLDIRGREHLRVRQRNVMLESATTSFQLHLQVAPAAAVRFFNAAVVASAPMVAVSANSPYLFGHDLWDETRIPLFEQAVEVGGIADAARGPVRRVTFGSGYLRESLFEAFRENIDHYPVLLPAQLAEPAERLPHLRLHNGTVWRWNRPLIGFDADGTPHLRIEHRVVPGGPTVTDAIANAAFFFGLVQFLATRTSPPEWQLPFERARDNFYASARLGLDAQVTWLEGRSGAVTGLVDDHLLPMARRGLETLAIDAADIDRWLGIITARVRNRCNGAAWQRAWVARHGSDMAALTAAYRERQDAGRPVHEWGI